MTVLLGVLCVPADEEKKEERAAVVSGPAKFFGATLSQAVNM
jgi:hypothetical protein